MAAAGPTFIARPLVSEAAPQEDVTTQILDFERASHLITESDAWSEGTCYCRHVQEHRGHTCSHPSRFCLGLGESARTMIRNGLASAITRERALEILAEARRRGLVQMTDNIRNQPGFICNCCKCCCEMLAGLRTLRHSRSVVTSGFVALIEPEKCTRCGRCAKVCPVQAISPTPSRSFSVDPALCIGCGVCTSACGKQAMKMRRTERRPYLPETLAEKIVVQALERGKLQNLVFDDPDKLTHRALGWTLHALWKLSPTQKLLASEQLKSGFVRLLLKLNGPAT